jgi:hypothetical protein
MTEKNTVSLFFAGFGLAATALLLLLPTEGSGQVTAPPHTGPAIVELFTSQGCSSCPPADAFLAELARDPSVVAISRPVTYWDQLGWKDSLARPQNTQLQREYAARGGARAGVYTPQMMVQGKYPSVGSSRADVNAFIARAHREASVTVGIADTSAIITGGKDSAQVKVIALRSSQMVRIGSGENGGRSIRYTNIVISERVIGTWTGGTQRFALPAERIPGADRFAIIVQRGTAGPILGGRIL